MVLLPPTLAVTEILMPNKKRPLTGGRFLFHFLLQNYVVMPNAAFNFTNSAL